MSSLCSCAPPGLSLHWVAGPQGSMLVRPQAREVPYYGAPACPHFSEGSEHVGRLRALHLGAHQEWTQIHPSLPAPLGVSVGGSC